MATTVLTEAQATAQLVEYLQGWDDAPPSDMSRASELIALAVTLMIEEGSTVSEAVTEAERQIGACALTALRWDCAAFEAGNEAALEGSIPF